MLKFFVNYVIETYDLFDNAMVNYIMTGAVGLVSYLVSFRVVGKMYIEDMISGSKVGHVFHWIIRLGIFLIITKLIELIKWCSTIPLYIWAMIGLVAGFVLTQKGVKKRLLYQKVKKDSF